MKAAFITAHGGNEVVRVRAHHLPERTPGEVRVRMRAATLNQVDLYMRNSGAGITHRLPQIMGLDGAGTIEACDASAPCCTPARQWSSTPASPAVAASSASMATAPCAHAFNSSESTGTVLLRNGPKFRRRKYFRSQPI